MPNERHVVITGGTGALGSAVVARMLRDGVRCHVTYVDDAELARFAHKDAVELHRVDCGDERAVQAFYASLPSVAASIHIVGGFTMAKVQDTTLADFERMFHLNTVTAFLCCREAVARMRPNGGRIVNVAARPALEPGAGKLAYTVSKAAVASLTVALAREVTSEGIFVNAVAPDTMDTAANRAAMPKADFSRWAKLEDVAETIAFLTGPGNNLTSGAIVPVYGRST